MWRVVVLSCFVALVNSESTNVAQCINHAGDLPINVLVNDCEEMPCPLYQLENSIVNVVFRAPRTIRSLRTLATAYLPIGPVTLPVPYDLGSDAITCNFLTNTYCPVLGNEVVSYRLLFFIESIFPVGVAPTVEFRVVDDSGSVQVPVVCFRVTIRITEPRQTLTAVTNTTVTAN